MINLAEYTLITEEQFSAMQFDCGVILTEFDPALPNNITSDKIFCATTGDINVNSGKEIVDLGEDVNNLHGELKELQYLSKRTHSISFTILNIDAATIAYALGAAEIETTGGSTKVQKVTLRNYLKLSDFKTIWWVGMLIGGGAVAVKLKDSLSTDDVSISSSKDGKGNASVTFKGFGTIADMSSQPFEYYYISEIPDMAIALDKYKATIAVNGSETLEATVTTPEGMTDITVSWFAFGDTVSITQNQSDQLKASVTGKKAGTIPVTATLRGLIDGKAYVRSANCMVTVTSGV